MERQVSNSESTYCMPNRREGFPKGRETRPGDSTVGSSRRARPVTIGRSFSLGPEEPRSADLPVRGAGGTPSPARHGARSPLCSAAMPPPSARRHPTPWRAPRTRSLATEPGHGHRPPTLRVESPAELRRGSSGCHHCGHDGKAGEVPRDAR